MEIAQAEIFLCPTTSWTDATAKIPLPILDIGTLLRYVIKMDVVSMAVVGNG